MEDFEQRYMATRAALRDAHDRQKAAMRHAGKQARKGRLTARAVQEIADRWDERIQALEVDLEYLGGEYDMLSGDFE